MADKYIDKFKYNDRYFLLDSGATHESNTHYLSGTLGNFKSNGTIVAEQGLFNKLIATNASIDSLDANNLTAQNATVVGLLDVQGQLKTNTWTNSNIATIEGNFFIAPTIVSKSTSSTKYQLTIQNQTSTNSEISSITGQTKRGWVLTIKGNFDLNQVGADLVTGESSTILNQWSQGSKVLITGDIEKTDGVYPLGTLTGFIYSSTTSSGSTPGSITIYNVTDNLGNTDIFTILEASTYNYREVKISLTQRYYSGLRPIGILMSAQGRSSKSFIDIYGGANILQSSTISGASSDYGGLAIPNVRIGNLRGLPNIRSGDFTNDAALPTGWGIYTDNGYFKGTIVSTSGEIGGYSLTANYLQSTDGTTGISVADNSTTASWAFWAGGTTTSTAKFRVDHNGVLYATGADISGAITADSGSIGGWSIGTDTNHSLYYGNQTPGATTTNLVLAPVSATNSTAIGGSGTGLKWFISAGRVFGVTTAGALYSTSGKIGGFEISDTYLRNGKLTSANNTTVAGVYLGANGLNVSGGSAASTAYIYKNGTSVSVNIGNKLTWNGTTLSVEGAIKATSLSTGSRTSSTSAAGTFIDANGAIYGGNNKFTVTSGGILTATDANLNNLTIYDSNGYKRAAATTSGFIIYDSNATTTTEIAKFGTTIEIGKENASHIEADANGIKIYNENGKLSSILYSNGMKVTDGQQSQDITFNVYTESNWDTFTASNEEYFTQNSNGIYQALVTLDDVPLGLYHVIARDSQANNISQYARWYRYANKQYMVMIDASYSGPTPATAIVRYWKKLPVYSHIGVYPDETEKYLFTVANGTSQAPSNALSVDGFGNLKAKGYSNFDRGYVSAISISAQSYTDVNVNFNKTFASIPTVVATLVSSSTSNKIGMVSVAIKPNSITTLGFTLRVFNADTTARSPAINWIAMDVN